MEKTAYLSNKGDIIIFSFRDKIIRFKGPYSLVRFDKIVFWDKGYIVVDTCYTHSSTLVEDYIDLVPILQDLYMDTEHFLEPIEKVEIKYA